MRRRLFVVVATVSLVGVIGGCGGSSDLPRDYSSTLTSFDENGPPVTPTSEPIDAAEITAYSTPEELIGAIGTAAGALDSVRVEFGSDDGPPVFVGDLNYGTARGFSGTLEATADVSLDLRRVGATFYVRSDPAGTWSSVAVDDPRLDDLLGDSGLTAYARLDVISDLRTTLLATDAVEDLDVSDIDGIPVRGYALDLDAARLALPTIGPPGQVDGSVTAELYLDADNLPVRLDVEYRPGLVARLGFSGWGDTVVVVTPTPDEVEKL